MPIKIPSFTTKLLRIKQIGNNIWSNGLILQHSNCFFELLSHLLCLIQYSNRTTPSPLYTVYSKIHRCIFYFRLREKKILFYLFVKRISWTQNCFPDKARLCCQLKSNSFFFSLCRFNAHLRLYCCRTWIAQCTCRWIAQKTRFTHELEGMTWDEIP